MTLFSDTMQKTCYFPDSHPDLQSQLDGFLMRIEEDLRQNQQRLEAVALLMAGGYGRGEGGIFIDEAGKENLYNDLEFYLFTHQPWLSELKTWAHEIEKEGSRRFGIDVEIKILSVKSLQQNVPSMFFYDLFSKHIIVYDSTDFFSQIDCSYFGDASKIPLHESTRLLFNRGSGLVFSAAKLQGIDPSFDSGFIQRNHAKLKLALGDAVLAINGRYHWSCRERAKRLRENLKHTPKRWLEVQGCHTEGVEFKFYPKHELLDVEELCQRQQRCVSMWSEVFLWLESLRLGFDFRSTHDYIRYSGILLPEFVRWKNPFLRIRDRLKYGQNLPFWFDYPRAVLQRALGAWLSQSNQLDGELASQVLSIDHKDLSSKKIFEIYQSWWSRYN